VIGGAELTLLDTYEEERLPIAAWILGVSNKLTTRTFNTDNPPARRDEETLQLGINYRDGRLACEQRATPGQVRAGDRAPDAPGLQGSDGEHRLFDVFRGTHFTLLAFGDGWDDVTAQAEAHCGSCLKSIVIHAADAHDATTHHEKARTIDTQGHAARAYDIQRDTLLIVRPDGYIGLVTEQRSVEPVLAYLAMMQTEAANRVA
jgi:hypothetical protein